MRRRRSRASSTKRTDDGARPSRTSRYSTRGDVGSCRVGARSAAPRPPGPYTSPGLAVTGPGEVTHGDPIVVIEDLHALGEELLPHFVTGLEAIGGERGDFAVP